MSLLTVCPVIIPPRPGLLDSWDHTPHLVVVNGAHDEWAHHVAGSRWDVATSPANLGCPASWNLGFRFAEKAGIRYVAILSQSFTARDGLAALAQLVDRQADERGLMTDHSFHCVVFAVDVWRDLGGFDEGLPIWADIDFLRRGYLAGIFAPYDRLPGAQVHGWDERCAAMRAGAIPAEWYETDKQRYIAKWGGPVGDEPDHPTPMTPEGGVVL